MLLNLLAYFVAGILIDAFYTLWYIGVANKNIAQATAGSFVITMLSYTLLYTLVLSPAFFLYLIAYAVGGSVGTGLVMLYQAHREVKSKTT